MEALLKGISGKVAVITGAGRGIGRAIAQALAHEEARVALLARTEAEIDAVARDLDSSAKVGSRRACGVRCDVSSAPSVHEAVEQAERALGPADILVNAAGDAVSAPLSRTDDELWNHLIAVNLTGTFLMIREIAPGMVRRGAGRIVNIASVSGLTGAPYVSAYSAAKHGVVGLTRCVSQELAKSGVTVNAVCPGYVDTSLTDRSVANIVQKTGLTEEQARAALAGRSPQNRMITAHEVAALVLYLVSDEGRGINGQAIVVDGGGLVS